MKNILAVKVALGRRGETEINSAFPVVNALGMAMLDDLDVTAGVLCPNIRERDNRGYLTDEILEIQPHALLLFGCCNCSAGVEIQVSLFNHDHVTGIPDAHPPIPVSCKNSWSLPAMATIPVDPIAKHLRDNGIPTRTNVIPTRCACAASAFVAASVVYEHGFPINLGLIHLPMTSEYMALAGDVLGPSLPLKTLLTAAEIICRNA